MPRKKLKTKILPSGYLRVNAKDPRFRKKLFNAIVKTAGNTKMALTLLHIRKRDFYMALKNYPKFKIAFEKARNRGIDIAEDEVIRRAVDGIERPEFYEGKIVGYVKEYSDYLMIRLLKAYREKYRYPRRSVIQIPGLPVGICFEESEPNESDNESGDAEGNL